MSIKQPAVQGRAKYEINMNYSIATPQKSQRSVANWTDSVQWHWDRGITLIPVQYREKRPIGSEWQKTTDPVAAFRDRVRPGEPCNGGILLGTVSKVVDVDLDCPIARDLGPIFLPKTDYCWGHAGNPRSHYLYRCHGDRLETVQHMDLDGKMIVELRGDGVQSVIPPSIHKSGNPIEYVSHGEPAEVDYQQLRIATGRIAAATLLVRYYAEIGGRNSYVLALSGVLAHAGWPVAEAESFVLTICSHAGDDELDSRRLTVRSTFEK